MTTARNAACVLDECFLEVRSKLLDVAASLDRIQRAENADQAGDDQRLRQIDEALAVLRDGSPDRAERIQFIFSDEYDENWDHG